MLNKIRKTILSILIIGTMCLLGCLITILSIRYIDESSMNGWIKTGEDQELMTVSSEFKFADKYEIVTFESNDETIRASRSSMAREKMKDFRFNKPYCVEVYYSIYSKGHSNETKKSNYLIKEFKPVELKNCTSE